MTKVTDDELDWLITREAGTDYVDALEELKNSRVLTSRLDSFADRMRNFPKDFPSKLLSETMHSNEVWEGAHIMNEYWLSELDSRLAAHRDETSKGESSELRFIHRVIDQHSTQALDPKFDEAGRVNDWRNYASDEVKEDWKSLSLQVRCALIYAFNEAAHNEEWD